MKIIEKILAFISLVIVLLSLSACKTKDNNNTGSGNNSGGVYEKGSYIQVVIKGELESQTQTDLFSALVYDLGLDVRFVDDSIAEVDREIVIGETNRSISASAYQKLRRLKKENETEVSYLIYVDGNDIAIAYEEDSYGRKIETGYAIRRVDGLLVSKLLQSCAERNNEKRIRKLHL